MTTRRSLPLLALAAALLLTLGFVWRSIAGRATTADRASRSVERTSVVDDARDPAPAANAPLDAPAPLSAESKRVVEDASARARSDGRIVVHGVLRDTEGRPITGNGVRLSLTRPDGTQSGSVDGFGRFELGPFAPGAYTLRAEAPYHKEGELELLLRAEEPSVTRDIVLAPWESLLVRARTPQGEPLARVMMASAAFDYSFRLRVVSSDSPPNVGAGGTLRAGDDAGGEYTGIGTLARGWDSEREPRDAIGRLRFSTRPRFAHLVLDDAVIDTQRIGRGGDEIVFVLSPEDLSTASAALRLRVVEADTGRPVAAAHVRIVRGESASSGATDERGVFERLGLGGAAVTLEIEAAGRASWKGAAQLRAGSVTDLGELALRAGVTLRGRVLGADGAGIDHTLELVPVDESSTTLTRFVVTEKDGAFQVDGLAAERYLLRSLPARHLDLARGGSRSLSVAARGCLLPRVVDPSEWNGELVLRLEPQGRLELKFGGDGTRDSSAMGEGEVEIATLGGLSLGSTEMWLAGHDFDLPRGPLRVTWRRPGHAPRTFDVVVGAEPSVVELR